MSGVVLLVATLSRHTIWDLENSWDLRGSIMGEEVRSWGSRLRGKQYSGTVG